MQQMTVLVGTTERPVDTAALARVAEVESAEVTVHRDGTARVSLSTDVDNMAAQRIEAWAALQPYPGDQRRFATLCANDRSLRRRIERLAGTVDAADLAEQRARKDADDLLAASHADLAQRVLDLQQQLASTTYSFAARLAALEAKPTPTLSTRRATAQTTLTLSIGGETTVPVVWPVGFPDDAYEISAAVVSGAVGTTKVTTRTQNAAGAVLAIKATGALVGVLSVVDATAIRFKA